METWKFISVYIVAAILHTYTCTHVYIGSSVFLEVYTGRKEQFQNKNITGKNTGMKSNQEKKTG